MTLNEYLLNEANISADEYLNKHNGIKNVFGTVLPLKKFIDALKTRGSKANRKLEIDEKLPKVDNHPIVPMEVDLKFKCADHPNDELEKKTPEEILQMNDEGKPLCKKPNDDVLYKKYHVSKAEIKMKEHLEYWLNRYLGNDKFTISPLDSKQKIGVTSDAGNELDADVFVALKQPTIYNGFKISGFAIMPDGKQYHQYNPRIHGSEEGEKKFIATLSKDTVRHTNSNIVTFNIPYTAYNDKIKSHGKWMTVELYLQKMAQRIGNAIIEVVNKESGDIIKKRNANFIKYMDHVIDKSGLDKEKFNSVYNKYDAIKSAAAKKFKSR